MGDLSAATVRRVVIAATLAFALIGALRFQTMGRAAAPPPPTTTPAATTTPARPIRVPLFVDPELTHHGSRFAFRWEQPGALDEFRRDEGLDAVVAGATSDEDRARRLMRWTRSQFEPGRPDPYPPPVATELLAAIRSGRQSGFCAQYAFLFVQAVQSIGMKARCVTVIEHELTEVWLDDEQRWTVVDPNRTTQLLGADGRSLDARELQAAFRSDAPVTAAPGSDPEEPLADYLARFDDFAVWLHNAFTSQPVNFRQFASFRIHYEPDPDRARARGAALETSLVEDLYAPPSDPGSH